MAKPVLTLALAAVAVAVAIPSLAGAAPSVDPKPAAPHTVASVQEQLAQLTVQDSQLVERYNQAVIDVAAKQKSAAAAQQAAGAAQLAYAAGRSRLAAAVTAQYESGSFSSTGALLNSQNGQNYLDQLETLGMISDRLTQQVAALQHDQQQASTARRTAAHLLAVATSTRAALARQKLAVAAQLTKYSSLLATLSTIQRTALLAQTSPVATAAEVDSAEAAITQATLRGGSTPAMKAVNFALAQLRKWYVWGSAGPSTFDCSGLTMRAWQAAGVSLPHSAADQYNYGTHVPATVAALQPGDLIFFYQPIGHVTIYIGNGLMVSAPETGEQVSIVPLAAFSGQVTGATRLS